MPSQAPGRAINITYDATGQVHSLAAADGYSLDPQQRRIARTENGEFTHRG